jgi:hypothetical protein
MYRSTIVALAILGGALVSARAGAQNPGQPLPDLVAVESVLRDNYVVVSRSGQRFLRLSSGLGNIGDTPVEVRGQAKGKTMHAFQVLFSQPAQALACPRKKDGSKCHCADLAAQRKTVTTTLVPIGEFIYHKQHKHWHLLQVAEYRLRDAAGAVVATSDKISFCLMDTHFLRVLPGSPRRPHYKKCKTSRSARSLHSGISIGWADVYDKNLPGQIIDITGLPPGPYTLEVEVNPDGIILEKTRSNNTASVPVTL